MDAISQVVYQGVKYNLKDELVNTEIENIKKEVIPTESTIVDKSTQAVHCAYPTIQSGTALTSLTVNAAKTDDTKNNAEEVFVFTTGDTITGISFKNVLWANSDTPTFKASKTYEIHIIYNSTIDKFLATYTIYG